MRVTVVVPVVPVRTLELASVPPVALRLTVAFAGWALESVAVTVTVAVEPGAPLSGSTRTVSLPPVCVCPPAAVTLTVTGYRVLLTKTLRL